MPLVKSDELDRHIKSGKVDRVYLFDGSENWLKEEAVKNLLLRFLKEESRDFNFEKFQAGSDDASAIANSTLSLPFLSDKRIVIVKSAENFNASDAKTIAAVIPEIPSTTCAIFLYDGKAKMKEEIPAVISTQGTIVTFWPPYPNQRSSWVVREAKKRGVTLTFDAAQVLTERLDELQSISNELDKLILFVGKKKTITLSDIEIFGYPDEEGNMRALENALYQRDLVEALTQAKLMQEMGIRAEEMIRVAEYLFRKLVLGAYYVYQERESAEQAAALLYFKGKTRVQQFQTAIQRYSRLEIETSLETITELDEEMKTGVLPAEIALTFLLRRLMGKQTLKAVI